MTSWRDCTSLGAPHVLTMSQLERAHRRNPANVRRLARFLGLDTAGNVAVTVGYALRRRYVIRFR